MLTYVQLKYIIVHIVVCMFDIYNSITCITVKMSIDWEEINAKLPFEKNEVS